MAEEKIDDEVKFGKKLVKDVNRCIECGMCRECPILMVLREEARGPRGRAILSKEDLLDKDIFYLCMLCGKCVADCPLGIDLPNIIRKARRELVKRQQETEENKKMVDNVRKYGNPFGDKPEETKEWYCC